MRCDSLLRIQRGVPHVAAVAALLTSTAFANAEPIGFVTRQDSNQVVVVDLSNGSVLEAISTLDTSPFEVALSRA
jgi:YVTN family beta-propeller protein